VTAVALSGGGVVEYDRKDKLNGKIWDNHERKTSGNPAQYP